MKGWDMFNKIKELKKQNFKKTQIARMLHADVRTIKKYWDMSYEEFQELSSSNRQRIVGSKLESYNSLILTWIKQYKDISASQIYDWLKERESNFALAERTVRKHVHDLRIKYEIPKIKISRNFMAAVETNPGEQAQVDMGQIKVLTSYGEQKKIYLFVMILSYSRFKFGVWQEKPFSTEDIISCHKKAFEYFGGVPKTIVYDQDKTMFVKENSGDIVKTKLFQKYLDSMNFAVHLCRSFDPQSKGKVEAAVKYFKNNFAKNRIFNNIDEFNNLCLEWLDRTANAKEHAVIKKVPAEMFKVEKEHLQQIPEHIYAQPPISIVHYSVSKDNTVMYKSNRYQLPVGTYSLKNKEVGVSIENDTINFFELKSFNLIHSYKISKEKGSLISDFCRHQELDEKTIKLKNAILEYFSYDKNLQLYLEKIEELKERYIKPQFRKINNFMKDYDKQIFLSALSDAILQNNFNLDFLLSLLEKYKNNKSFDELNINLPENLKGVVPDNRNLLEYERKLVK